MTEQELHAQLYPEAHAKPEYIICAAIHFNDGKTYPHQPDNIKSGIVICGRRHHNCFTTAFVLNEGKKIIEQCTDVNGRSVQGFLTSKNRFVDRKEAAQIAIERGQITRKAEILFSEDLY
jgi:hypothetical protein